MTSKRTNIIVVVTLAAVLGLIMVITFLNRRVSMNDESVLGNTAGNLYNDGLFCEYDGKVYFANAYDDGTLYCMNVDESDIRKLSNSQVKYINAAGKYLYYYQTNSTAQSGLSFIRRINGLFRTSLKGKKPVCLSRDSALTTKLVGNYIYYQHYDKQTAVTLRKIKIDKTDDVEVADYVINPACCEDGIIYFNGTEDDHNLYALDTRTDQISMLLEANLWNPIVQDGYVYYMDVDNNYRLCRQSLSTQEVEVLSQERLEFFNLYDNIIYYQTNSDTAPALKRVMTDGSNDETVAPGIYHGINITSQYVYFMPFETDIPMYKTSTFGSVNVTAFDAAAAAVMEID